MAGPSVVEIGLELFPRHLTESLDPDALPAGREPLPCLVQHPPEHPPPLLTPFPDLVGGVAVRLPRRGVRLGTGRGRGREHRQVPVVAGERVAVVGNGLHATPPKSSTPCWSRAAATS